MKNIVYLTAIILGLVVSGCNPMEDIYDEQGPSEIEVLGEVEFTLTDDDYDDLDKNFGNFDSEEEAKTLLPGLLKSKYPAWGQGSSALVGYNLYVGSAEGISDYSGSDVYELTKTDYEAAGSDALGFYPNVDPKEFLGDILETEIDSPEEGQIVLAKYNQYINDPVIGLASIVDYDFVGSFEGWSITDVVGAQGWTSEAAYIQGNGFDGGAQENDDWLVSPTIDLSGESDVKFQISQAINYATDLSLMKILVATDYSGDVTTATWNEIVLTNTPAGNSNDFIVSEDYDFSAYDGLSINIAFHYTSTATDAGRWRINQMMLKTIGVTGATNQKGDYFVYTEGAWEPSSGLYYLSSADFNSMGTGSGQPGENDTFGSSISPDNYLGTFLKLKFPYAQEEDELIVIYDYFSSSSGAQRRGNLYTFGNGEWTGHQSVIATTLQFGLDNGVWVPDNTIRYTLASNDYATIGAALASKYPDAASSASNYGNFDRRVGNAAYWSNEMLAEAFAVLLEDLAPNAAEGQKYVFTILIYNGSSGEESLALIKSGDTWILN